MEERPLFGAELIILVPLVLLVGVRAALPLFATSPTKHDLSRKQLFLFLKGITSDLPSNQIGTFPPEFATLVSDIKKIPGFAGATFKTYSYNGVLGGMVQPYHCEDALSLPFGIEIHNLQDQIVTELSGSHSTDVYLIGHSLGGAVAFGYAAELLRNPAILPSGNKLKAVIMLDGPLGGLSLDSIYISVASTFLAFRCFATFGVGTQQTFHDLIRLFSTASSTPAPDDGPRGSDPQGAQANILDRTDLSNENIAEQLQAAGTSFLAIGNTNDFVYDPKACNSAFPDFVDTQFLGDEGNGSGLYGRSFSGTPATCHHVSSGIITSCASLATELPLNSVEVLDLLRCTSQTVKFIKDAIALANDIVDSHVLSVLSPKNTAVRTGIVDFLTPIPTTGIGGTPSTLTPVPAAD